MSITDGGFFSVRRNWRPPLGQRKKSGLPDHFILLRSPSFDVDYRITNPDSGINRPSIRSTLQMSTSFPTWSTIHTKYTRTNGNVLIYLHCWCNSHSSRVKAEETEVMCLELLVYVGCLKLQTNWRVGRSVGNAISHCRTYWSTQSAVVFPGEGFPFQVVMRGLKVASVKSDLRAANWLLFTIGLYHFEVAREEICFMVWSRHGFWSNCKKNVRTHVEFWHSLSKIFLPYLFRWMKTKVPPSSPTFAISPYKGCWSELLTTARFTS